MDMDQMHGHRLNQSTPLAVWQIIDSRQPSESETGSEAEQNLKHELN